MQVPPVRLLSYGRTVTDLLELLGSSLPVLAAPMAGGPATPALVLAASDAGSAGFLAGGYKTPELLAEQVAEVRATTGEYGVNLFAPNVVPVDPAAYAAYRELLLPLAERFGVDLPVEPVEDDDGWRDKVDVLVEARHPIVSFTFGLPDAAGARGAPPRGLHAGADRHLGRRGPAGRRGRDGRARRPVRRRRRPLGGLRTRPASPSGCRSPRWSPPWQPPASSPIIATGGVGSSADVAAALAAGAQAVAVGTLLLLAPEAGTNPAHRAGLTGPDRGAHLTTTAFSGRPAGGLAQRLPGGVRREGAARLPGAAPPDQPDPARRRRAGGPGARQHLGRCRSPPGHRAPSGGDPLGRWCP